MLPPKKQNSFALQLVYIVPDFFFGLKFECFEEKENDFFVVSDTILQTEKKFCRKCFKQYCYTPRFLFPNVFIYL